MNTRYRINNYIDLVEQMIKLHLEKTFFKQSDVNFQGMQLNVEHAEDFKNFLPSIGRLPDI